MLFGNKRRKWERENETLVAQSLSELEDSKWNNKSAEPQNLGAARLKLSGYNIDKAIELLKKLPSSDERLVTTIVQQTLESAHINVMDLIQDAEGKVVRLEIRVKSLQEKIQDLEQEIKNHRQEIEKHEIDLADTKEAKRKLQLAKPPVPVISVESELPAPVTKLVPKK